MPSTGADVPRHQGQAPPQQQQDASCCRLPSAAEQPADESSAAPAAVTDTIAAAVAAAAAAAHVDQCVFTLFDDHVFSHILGAIPLDQSSGTALMATCKHAKALCIKHIKALRVYHNPGQTTAAFLQGCDTPPLLGSNMAPLQGGGASSLDPLHGGHASPSLQQQQQQQHGVISTGVSVMLTQLASFPRQATLRTLRLHGQLASSASRLAALKAQPGGAEGPQAAEDDIAGFLAAPLAGHRFAQVHTLNISACLLSESSLRAIRGSFSNVCTLCISNCSLHPSSFQIIAQLPRLQSLQLLARTDIVSAEPDPGCLSPLAQLGSTLQRLVLKEYGLIGLDGRPHRQNQRPVQLQLGSALPGLTRLTKLTAPLVQKVTDTLALQDCSSLVKSLEALTLPSLCCTTPTAVMPVLACTALTRLCVDGNFEVRLRRNTPRPMPEGVLRLLLQQLPRLKDIALVGLAPDSGMSYFRQEPWPACALARLVLWSCVQASALASLPAHVLSVLHAPVGIEVDPAPPHVVAAGIDNFMRSVALARDLSAVRVEVRRCSGERLMELLPALKPLASLSGDVDLLLDAGFTVGGEFRRCHFQALVDALPTLDGLQLYGCTLGVDEGLLLPLAHGLTKLQGVAFYAARGEGARASNLKELAAAAAGQLEIAIMRQPWVSGYPEFEELIGELEALGHVVSELC